MKSICHKCFHFEPCNTIDDGMFVAYCNHPKCYKTEKYIDVFGDIQTRRERIANIETFNIDNNCPKFASFNVVKKRKKWWIFPYTVEGKVKAEQNLSNQSVPRKSDDNIHTIGERVYAQEWTRLNNKQNIPQGAFTYLEQILSPNNWDTEPPLITKHDAHIALLIIQWLGTTCGNSFIQNCVRKIEEECKERL